MVIRRRPDIIDDTSSKIAGRNTIVVKYHQSNVSAGLLCEAARGCTSGNAMKNDGISQNNWPARKMLGHLRWSHALLAPEKRTSTYCSGKKSWVMSQARCGETTNKPPAIAT